MWLKGKTVSSLFDTGIAIFLIDGQFKRLLSPDAVAGQNIKLCGANDAPLVNLGTYELNLAINEQKLRTCCIVSRIYRYSVSSEWISCQKLELH